VSTPEEPRGWLRFDRIGEVIAEQVDHSWSWTTHSGDSLGAEPGDWMLRRCADGPPWSVRDDIFRASYRHIAGNRWQRTGSVLARPAAAGETVDTLEGPVRTAAGDWVVRGSAGECWPVGAAEFARRYRRVDPQSGGGRGLRLQ